MLIFHKVTTKATKINLKLEHTFLLHIRKAHQGVKKFKLISENSSIQQVI